MRPIPVRQVNMSPEALAALNAVSDKPIKKPLSVKTINVIRQRVAKTLHGPLMKPTLRQQLLGFPSYRAVAAVWAADHFQKMYSSKEAW